MRHSNNWHWTSLAGHLELPHCKASHGNCPPLPDGLVLLEGTSFQVG